MTNITEIRNAVTENARSWLALYSDDTITTWLGRTRKLSSQLNKIVGHLCENELSGEDADKLIADLANGMDPRDVLDKAVTMHLNAHEAAMDAASETPEVVDGELSDEFRSKLAESPEPPVEDDDYASYTSEMARTLARHKVNYTQCTAASGAKSLSNGDSLAEFLKGIWPQQVALLIDLVRSELGEEYEPALEKYRGLNEGQVRMNSGNMIRARVLGSKKRKSVISLSQVQEIYAANSAKMNALAGVCPWNAKAEA